MNAGAWIAVLVPVLFGVALYANGWWSYIQDNKTMKECNLRFHNEARIKRDLKPLDLKGNEIDGESQRP